MNTKAAIGNLKLIVHDMLYGPNRPSTWHINKADLARTLVVYHKVFAPNFILWLRLTEAACESEVAKQACAENLQCEVDENHPYMLLRFALPIYQNSSLLNKENEVKIRKALVQTEELVLKLTRLSRSGIPGLLIMAALENASLEFMQFLRDAAKQLGVSDLEYADKHGMADVEHADAFVKAVDAEFTHQGGYTAGEEKEMIQGTIPVVKELLEIIFHC